jgi:hypothetical protein
MVSPTRRELSKLERNRLIGRRAGIAIFTAIFAGATLLWTIQILTTVWGSAPPSPAGCAGGTANLERAVERARETHARNAGDEDERAALSRYRSALEPEWEQRKAVEAACENDEAGKKRLKDVIALRYAEEHAVRYESLGLAPLRRRLKGTDTSSSNELNR